jgi:phenylacetate-CoA ligase
LYTLCFQSALLPALDVLNGTRVAQIYNDLLESQWLPLERHEAVQRRKLDDLLGWTKANAPFYEKHWAQAPAHARASSLYPQLDGIPVVTKPDMRGALSAFPLSAYEGKVIKVHTSGSTGEPMVFYRSAEQESWFWALRMRMWTWGGYRPGEAYLTLNLNSRSAWHKRIQDVLFRCSYHGFNANSHDVDAVLQDLKRKRVKHLVGYASSLFLLSRAMRERGIENPGVQSILSTGDTLLPSYRSLVEEVFGVKVCDYYGAGGEGIHIASQCERRRAYHLHLENAVIEFLKDGRPARPGELGEIVVTQLDNQAMPLVRYATQDLAMVSKSGRCECGRELPLVEGVQGRVPDIVVAPDGTYLVVHFFTILFEYLPEVRQFQIVQRRPDTIIAKVVRNNGYDAARIEARIRDAIAKVTNGSLSVEFEYVGDIPLSPSLKRRFVISELMKAPFSTSSSPLARRAEVAAIEMPGRA